MDQIFFKIHIAHLFQGTFGYAWLNPTTLSRDISNLLFQNTMGMSDMPDHIQEKPYDQTVASIDILLHAKSKLSISDSFWGIKF